MTTSSTAPARRVGRPCAVCALPAPQREQVEIALAQGTSISSIAKQHGAPGRESITHHIKAGHVRADLDEKIARAQGMDWTTVSARIAEIAQRARTTALEAAEAGDRQGVLRAGDSELRALSVLATSGADSEYEIARNAWTQDVALAVVRVGRRGDQAVDAVANELVALHRPEIADEIRALIPESRTNTTDALEASA
ncbi:hypothetical protein AB1K56_07090 [Microbacterium sp. BWR-S6Y]|uniref:hypothetical protein n=1 Tax=Microbacterium sp. BWR-S6Y TaxID=3232073 RepID=UPI0035299F9B